MDRFATITRDLELRAGDRLRVDLTMSVGGLTEETRVVAETPLLETTTVTRSRSEGAGSGAEASDWFWFSSHCKTRLRTWGASYTICVRK